MSIGMLLSSSFILLFSFMFIFFFNKKVMASNDLFQSYPSSATTLHFEFYSENKEDKTKKTTAVSIFVKMN